MFTIFRGLHRYKEQRKCIFIIKYLKKNVYFQKSGKQWKLLTCMVQVQRVIYTRSIFVRGIKCVFNIVHF